jgi:hypothetical protein
MATFRLQETRMTIFAFLAALAVTVFVIEILSVFQYMTTGRIRSILDGPKYGESLAETAYPKKKRATMLYAILIALFPKRFDEKSSPNVSNVVDLLRRSGYYYSTPGAFYAAAIQDFSKYLMLGALLAGAIVVGGNNVAIVPLPILVFSYIGLRKPYNRLRDAIKKRRKAFRNNMLVGLSLFESLLSGGLAVQDALRETGRMGGPFCNLLTLLVVQIEKTNSVTKAVETIKAHLPDARDIEANLFIGDVLGFFEDARPILTSVTASRVAIHRQVLEDTEARASVVRQSAGLFGIAAVLGMLLSILAPFSFVAL